MIAKKVGIYTSAVVLALLSSTQIEAAYPDLPVGIKNGTGVLIQDTLYVGLGTGGDKFYALDLKTPHAQWQTIADFPGKERSQAISATIDGELYVFGGLQKNSRGELQFINDAYRYNPKENRWVEINTRSPRGLVGASAVANGDKIYILGGSNTAIFNGYFQDYEKTRADKVKQDAVVKAYFNQRPQDYFFTTELLSYQPSTNQWRNEGQLPFAGRAGATFTIHDQQLMVVNGEIKPGLRSAKTHLGKFVANGIQWKNLPDLPAPKGLSQDGLAGAMGGYSYGHYLVAGGANFPGSVKQFQQGNLYAHQGLSKAWHKEVYTFDQGKWKIIGELPKGIGYGVAISYLNKVLLIGGETEKGQTLTSIYSLSYDGKTLKIE